MAVQERSLADPAHRFGISLACPRCKAAMDDLECFDCDFRMGHSGNLLDALLPERVAHYSRFIADYERIRRAEGRGSTHAAFYLNLPYKDITSANSKQWAIRARSFSYLLEHILGLTGRGQSVLDQGAGNGWMSYRLALAGYQPVAVDLLTNEEDGLGAAIHFCRQLPRPFPRVRAEMDHLPFQDAQFDTIIFNASLHYSEDYEATLREALRCTKPGGSLIVCETPWYSRMESGRQMLKEREANFLKQYGTASNSLHSCGFLTDTRLRILERQLNIQWSVHQPYYGFNWAMRPVIAKLRNLREPSQFRIYVARRNA